MKAISWLFASARCRYFKSESPTRTCRRFLRAALTFLEGWGIQLSLRGGWVWSIWGFDCVVVQYGRKKLRIGTDDAENSDAISSEPNPRAVREGLRRHGSVDAIVQMRRGQFRVFGQRWLLTGPFWPKNGTVHPRMPRERLRTVLPGWLRRMVATTAFWPPVRRRFPDGKEQPAGNNLSPVTTPSNANAPQIRWIRLAGNPERISGNPEDDRSKGCEAE